MRADSQRNVVSGNGCGRPAGGAAGSPFPVVGVAGVARVEKGQFGGDRLAHDHRPGIAQAFHQSCVSVGYPALKGRAPALCRHGGRVDNVLEPDRHAMQRADAHAGPPDPVHLGGLAQCLVRIEMGPGLDLRLGLLDPGQARLDQIDGAEAAFADFPGGIGSRQ